MSPREDRRRYASALLDLTETLVRQYRAPAGVVLSTVQRCLVELGGTAAAPLDQLEREVRERLAAEGHLPVNERLRLVDLTRVEDPQPARPGA